MDVFNKEDPLLRKESTLKAVAEVGRKESMYKFKSINQNIKDGADNMKFWIELKFVCMLLK